MISENIGLTSQGYKAIEAMNDLKILIDLSHSNPKTALDSIQASKTPIAITHTGCSKVFNHPRNKSDQELKLLANKGGVVGIYIMPYLCPEGPPKAIDVILHIEHALNVAGEDHVGIGTDGDISPVVFNDEYKKNFKRLINNRKKSGISAQREEFGSWIFANDLNTPDRFQILGEMLHKRGHSWTKIDKILGSNFARLFKEVW